MDLVIEIYARKRDAIVCEKKKACLRYIKVNLHVKGVTLYKKCYQHRRKEENFVWIKKENI